MNASSRELHVSSINEFTQDVCAFWNGRAELGQMAGTRDVIAKQLEVDTRGPESQGNREIPGRGCTGLIQAAAVERRPGCDLPSTG